MGIREWDDIPTEIPPEHFDGFTAVLEAEARDRHSENRLWFKRRMGDYQAAYAQADYLREAVPAAVERLRPAYPDDLDKAHRPVRLALLGIEATACLDCAWLSEVDHVVTGERSPIGSHRGLHWDPPHANLCYFLHDGYETLAPQRFPDPWEVFEPLLYGPVATKARTFGQRKGKREFLFCDRCFERVGRDDFEPCKPGETPWTWDGDAGGFRWIENL